VTFLIENRSIDVAYSKLELAKNPTKSLFLLLFVWYKQPESCKGRINIAKIARLPVLLTL